MAVEGISWMLAVVGGGRWAKMGEIVGELWSVLGAFIGGVAGGYIGEWGFQQLELWLVRW